MRVGGLKEKALRCLTAAIEADPNHADAYEARSNVYISMGRTDDGLADMKKALNLERKSGINLRDNSIG